MANGKLSRVHVGLALASALVVLLASGVAISRISEQNDESPVATGPSSTSSSVPGLGGKTGPAVGSGPATAAGVGGAAEQAAQGAGGAASETSAVTGPVERTARKAAANPGAASGAAASPATGRSTAGGTPSGGAGSQGGGSTGGGSTGGGQASPPAPSQSPPEPLAAASVSVGHGADGAVVGLGLGNDRPADPDVTIGTNPVVGDHPPAEGTGVTLGGRFLHPPPSLPTPPG